MSIVSIARNASIDEIAAEMDRRGKVIERLEATIDRLTAAAATAREEAECLRPMLFFACLHPEKIQQVRERPSQLGWFVGMVMKATGGKYSPTAIENLFRQALCWDPIPPSTTAHEEEKGNG